MAEIAVFDGEAAERVVAELRESYNSGKTRSYEWRVNQLKNLLKLVCENEEEMVQTVHSDLYKPEFEAFAHEVSRFISFFSLISPIFSLKELKLPFITKISVLSLIFHKRSKSLEWMVGYIFKGSSAFSGFR